MSDLNDHHRGLTLNYLRFARFQRGLCLKAVRGCFEDAKDTKFPDATYTVDEIRDALDDLAQETSVEVEAELLNSAHTNVLLLQQVFAQAQVWHLDLDADLAELENRELLDKVKSWEDQELAGQKVGERPSLSPQKKTLAPLGGMAPAGGGPAQLLKAQLEDARAESAQLRARVADLERAATSALSGKERAEAAEQKARKEREEDRRRGQEEEDEVRELEAAVKTIKFQMASEQELSAKSQKEMETHLKDARHALLDVQHQLKMAEKELERKFSETGAYKNLKKMLSSKNEQIRELRAKVARYEEGEEEEEEE